MRLENELIGNVSDNELKTIKSSGRLVIDVHHSEWRAQMYATERGTTLLLSGDGNDYECKRVAADFLSAFDLLLSRDKKTLVFRIISEIKLLLVENNPGDVFLAKELLKGSEFSIDIAGTLDFAVEIYEKNHPDLVLLDLGLPDSQGEETYLRFSGMCPNAAILIWSDLADTAIARRLMTLGARGYLVKSFLTFDSGEELMVRCRRAMKRTPRSKTE